MNNVKNTIAFNLPQNLSCIEPTEERGLNRDAVRLLVTRQNHPPRHDTFNHLDNYLNVGDVLVVNTSATVPAALPFKDITGQDLRVHFSTRIANGKWLVEIRAVKENKTIRWYEGYEGMVITFQGGALELKSQYYEDRSMLNLWVAEWHSAQNLLDYLKTNGQPIQYENLHNSYPIDYYQTLFSTHEGSSEMPSAGRGFTQDLLNRLLRKGIQIAPVLLHTGISSLEENEPPYPEYMEIDQASASVINTAKREGKRIIAVGTTAIRALETAFASGQVKAYKGFTDLYITGNHEMQVANGMLTGFHEPKASHLHMLQSMAGLQHIDNAYNAAIEGEYHWHQFGDLHLILP